MSKLLVTLDELGQFDEIIDVRSPAEYAEDRIPGAINCPALDNAQRATIGTLYVQHSPFEARRLGGALVAENIGRHLRVTLADRPKAWRPLVYCWRGGMRSGSFVTWMRLIGWQACQLEGGYKTWRHHVRNQLETLPAKFHFRVLCGSTGSGKTALLAALARHGAQVLDLEQMAAHRGSILGEIPGQPQPSQKWFETCIARKLSAFDPGQTVFIEAESHRIGALLLPEKLVEHMRNAPCIEIRATAAQRLEFLLREYAWLGDDAEALATKLTALHGFIDNATLQAWLHWARTGNLRDLFAGLIERHYDPSYTRSQKRQFVHYAQARQCPVATLDPDGLEKLARDIIATL